MKKFLLILVLIFSTIFTTSCNKSPVSTSATDTEKPTNIILPSETNSIETTPSDEITWDKSKYEVFVTQTPQFGRKSAFEVLPSFCNDASHLNPAPPSTVTVDFMGKSYTAEYFSSSCVGFCSDQLYSYSSMSQNVYFSIDGNGTLVSFSFILPKLDASAPKISSTEATAKAKIYFEQLFETSFADSLYQTEEPLEMEDLEGNIIYEVRFQKYVGGIRTVDSVSITIDEAGEIIRFTSNICDDYNSLDTSFIDTDEINSVFDEATEYIYGGVKGVTNKQMYEPSLRKLKDGTLIFICAFSLEVKQENAEDIFMQTVHESNSIIIKLLTNE